jgi:hypothetical protein
MAVTALPRRLQPIAQFDRLRVTALPREEFSKHLDGFESLHIGDTQQTFAAGENVTIEALGWNKTALIDVKSGETFGKTLRLQMILPKTVLEHLKTLAIDTLGLGKALLRLVQMREPVKGQGGLEMLSTMLPLGKHEPDFQQRLGLAVALGAIILGDATVDLVRPRAAKAGVETLLRAHWESGRVLRLGCPG